MNTEREPESGYKPEHTVNVLRELLKTSGSSY